MILHDKPKGQTTIKTKLTSTSDFFFNAMAYEIPRNHCISSQWAILRARFLYKLKCSYKSSFFVLIAQLFYSVILTKNRLPFRLSISIQIAGLKTQDKGKREQNESLQIHWNVYWTFRILKKITFSLIFFCFQNAVGLQYRYSHNPLLKLWFTKKKYYRFFDWLFHDMGS